MSPNYRCSTVCRLLRPLILYCDVRLPSETITLSICGERTAAVAQYSCLHIAVAHARVAAVWRALNIIYPLPTTSQFCFTPILNTLGSLSAASTARVDIYRRFTIFCPTDQPHAQCLECALIHTILRWHTSCMPCLCSPVSPVQVYSTRGQHCRLVDR